MALPPRAYIHVYFWTVGSSSAHLIILKLKKEKRQNPNIEVGQLSTFEEENGMLC